MTREWSPELLSRSGDSWSGTYSEEPEVSGPSSLLPLYITVVSFRSDFKKGLKIVILYRIYKTLSFHTGRALLGVNPSLFP